MDLTPTIKGFTLINYEKYDRALNGTPNASGGKQGGIIKSDGTYSEDELLAEYDKLGGLLTKNGDKVKTGSFYDFRNKKPREIPEVVFVYRVNKKEIEVSEGKELPGIVKAARIMEGKEEIDEKLDEKLEEPIADKTKISELTKKSKDELIAMAQEIGIELTGEETRDILIDALYGKV